MKSIAHPFRKSTDTLLAAGPPPDAGFVWLFINGWFWPITDPMPPDAWHRDPAEVMDDLGYSCAIEVGRNFSVTVQEAVRQSPTTAVWQWRVQYEVIDKSGEARHIPVWVESTRDFLQLLTILLARRTPVRQRQ